MLMNNSLALKLIEKGVIRQGTVFTAIYLTHGLSCVSNARVSGFFVVERAGILPDKNVVIHTGQSSANRCFMADDIVNIDGMDIERLAKIYNLTTDGKDIIQGKRRGRPRSQPSTTSAE